MTRLDDICIRLVSECETREEAVGKLIPIIEASADFTAQAVRLAAMHWVKLVRTYARDVTAGGEVGSPFVNPAVAAAPSHFAKYRAAAFSLFDIRLPGLADTRLGDATAEDLAVTASHYLTKAESLQARGEAYQRLHARLVKSNRKTVREAFKEAQVKKILGDAL